MLVSFPYRPYPEKDHKTGEIIGEIYRPVGAFWIHLVQNYFFLDYVNKVWSVAKEDPWPKEIKI